MRKDEAQARSEQLNREHPDRATYRWFPREDGPGGWTVARVTVGPQGVPTGTLQPSKPESADTVPGTLPGGVQPWAAGG
jgi:hypothetical protein